MALAATTAAVVLQGVEPAGAATSADPPVDQLGGLYDCQVAGEDRPEGFLEAGGTPDVPAAAFALAQHGLPAWVEVCRVLERNPAGTL